MTSSETGTLVNGAEAPGAPGGDGANEMHPGEDIKVLIVDEQRLFRDGLAGLLKDEPGIHVVATASDAGEAIGAARQQRPDVVLLGSDAFSPNALADLNPLPQLAPLSKIVVLATRDDPRRIEQLLSSGAQAVILKDATVEELLTTIRIVGYNRDRVVLSVSRQTMNKLRAGGEPMLSDRELEVLVLVAEGMRNSQIAAKLFIAEGTVKRHLTNIYAKLGATSRTDAVMRAARAGLA